MLYISLYCTAQRFGHVDALLRQVTNCVMECNKLWRFQRLSTFDAWELENATNPRLLTPLNKKCWFVRDRDYNAYDALASVRLPAGAAEGGVSGGKGQERNFFNS